jgi:hypothetical protein
MSKFSHIKIFIDRILLIIWSMLAVLIYQQLFEPELHELIEANEALSLFLVLAFAFLTFVWVLFGRATLNYIRDHQRIF